LEDAGFDRWESLRDRIVIRKHWDHRLSGSPWVGDRESDRKADEERAERSLNPS
jgi:hypothetical protein